MLSLLTLFFVGTYAVTKTSYATAADYASNEPSGTCRAQCTEQQWAAESCSHCLCKWCTYYRLGDTVYYSGSTSSLAKAAGDCSNPTSLASWASTYDIQDLNQHSAAIALSFDFGTIDTALYKLDGLTISIDMRCRQEFRSSGTWDYGESLSSSYYRMCVDTIVRADAGTSSFQITPKSAAFGARFNDVYGNYDDDWGGLTLAQVLDASFRVVYQGKTTNTHLRPSNTQANFLNHIEILCVQATLAYSPKPTTTTTPTTTTASTTKATTTTATTKTTTATTTTSRRAITPSTAATTVGTRAMPATAAAAGGGGDGDATVVESGDGGAMTIIVVLLLLLLLGGGVVVVLLMKRRHDAEAAAKARRQHGSRSASNAATSRSTSFYAKRTNSRSVSRRALNAYAPAEPMGGVTYMMTNDGTYMPAYAMNPLMGGGGGGGYTNLTMAPSGGSGGGVPAHYTAAVLSPTQYQGGVAAAAAAATTTTLTGGALARMNALRAHVNWRDVDATAAAAAVAAGARFVLRPSRSQPNAASLTYADASATIKHLLLACTDDGYRYAAAAGVATAASLDDVLAYVGLRQPTTTGYGAVSMAAAPPATAYENGAAALAAASLTQSAAATAQRRALAAHANYRNFDATGAAALLAAADAPRFILRPSQSNAAAMSVSYKSGDGDVKHVLVSCVDGGLRYATDTRGVVTTDFNELLVYLKLP